MALVPGKRAVNPQPGRRPGKPRAYLTAGEVAAKFLVTSRTARLWARAGKLGAFRTPGRQWRFPRAVVEAALATGPERADHDRPADGCS
ncbi:helix-turn-helix domain-containing protein [Longispora urticae]